MQVRAHLYVWVPVEARRAVGAPGVVVAESCTYEPSICEANILPLSCTSGPVSKGLERPCLPQPSPSVKAECSSALNSLS